jgi:hypothetical protein
LVTAVAGELVAPGDEKVMTVYQASPLGTLPAGSEITITYYVADVSTPTEPAPTTSESPAPGTSPAPAQ